MSSAQLASRSANVGPADDELVELMAQLLERAWRRRHPAVETIARPSVAIAAPNGDEATR